MAFGYMPSEAARLVLGYLKETNCNLTEEQFLEESVHLKEYSQCLQSGYRYPTSIEGYSLAEILRNFYVLTHLSSCSEDEIHDFLDNFMHILPKLQRLLKSREIKKRKNVKYSSKGVSKSYKERNKIGKRVKNVISKTIPSSQYNNTSVIPPSFPQNIAFGENSGASCSNEQQTFADASTLASNNGSAETVAQSQIRNSPVPFNSRLENHDLSNDLQLVQTPTQVSPTPHKSYENELSSQSVAESLKDKPTISKNSKDVQTIPGCSDAAENNIGASDIQNTTVRSDFATPKPKPTYLPTNSPRRTTPLTPDTPNKRLRTCEVSSSPSSHTPTRTKSNLTFTPSKIFPHFAGHTPSKANKASLSHTPGRTDSMLQNRSPLSSHTPARTGSMLQNRSPLSSHTPGRNDSMLQNRSPLSSHTPARTDSMLQNRSPLSSHTPGRNDSMLQNRSPLSSHTPGRTDSMLQNRSALSSHTPGRTDSMLQNRSPLSSHTPARTDSMLQNRSPLSSHTPARTDSTLQSHTPGRTDSLLQSLTPGRNSSPFSSHALNRTNANSPHQTPKTYVDLTEKQNETFKNNEASNHTPNITNVTTVAESNPILVSHTTVGTSSTPPPNHTPDRNNLNTGTNLTSPCHTPSLSKTNLANDKTTPELNQNSSNPVTLSAPSNYTPSSSSSVNRNLANNFEIKTIIISSNDTLNGPFTINPKSNENSQGFSTEQNISKTSTKNSETTTSHSPITSSSPISSPQSVTFILSSELATTPETFIPQNCSVLSNKTSSPIPFAVRSSPQSVKNPHSIANHERTTKETGTSSENTTKNIETPSKENTNKSCETISLSMDETIRVPSPSFPNLTLENTMDKLPPTPLKSPFYLRQHSPLDFSRSNSSHVFRSLNNDYATPVNSVKPDLPSRYPDAISPRYNLAQQRSSRVTSLTTPIKEFPPPDNSFFSPRRKNLIPRRRLLGASPSSKKTGGETSEVAASMSHDEQLNYNAMLEELVNYTPLVEKLTENINQVVFTNESPSKGDEVRKTLDINLPDSLVKDIIDKTESDPVFTEILNMFFDKTESSRDSFDVTSCMADLANSVTLHRGDETDVANCDVESETFDQNVSKNDSKIIEVESSKSTINIPGFITSQVTTSKCSTLFVESHSDALQPGVYVISNSENALFNPSSTVTLTKVAEQMPYQNAVLPLNSTPVRVLDQPIMSTGFNNSLPLLLNATAVTPIKISIPDLNFFNVSNGTIVGMPQVVLNQNYTSSCNNFQINEIKPDNLKIPTSKRSSVLAKQSKDKLHVRALTFDSVTSPKPKPKRTSSRTAAKLDKPTKPKPEKVKTLKKDKVSSRGSVVSAPNPKPTENINSTASKRGGTRKSTDSCSEKLNCRVKVVSSLTIESKSQTTPKSVLQSSSNEQARNDKDIVNHIDETHGNDDKVVAAALVALASRAPEETSDLDKEQQILKKRKTGRKKSTKMLEKMDVDKFLEKIHPSNDCQKN